MGDGVGAPQVKECSHLPAAQESCWWQPHAPQGHMSGAGERELCGGWRHALGMFCPCYARLVPADPIQPDLPTDGLPREPRALHVPCEQMLSRPVRFQGIASDELHGTSCQQLWLSCRLSLVHQAWLLLFFFPCFLF